MKLLVAMAALSLPIVGFAESIQPLIDSAAPGSTLILGAGIYEGPAVINKPLTIKTVAGATIRGNGKGSVVWIHAPHVTVEGFHITGSGLDLLKDNAAVYVQGDFATVRANRIDDSLHGIYVKKVADCQIVGNRIRGKTLLASGAKETVEFKPDDSQDCDVELNQNRRGNGIHLWNSERITVRDNEITDARDGIYFSFTHHSQVIGNHISHVRFGLHYMYSDYNYFEGNVFANNSAGATVMYSSGLMIRNNSFCGNVGHRAYGLVLTSVDSSRLEYNQFIGNSVGLFIELSNNNVFVGNRILRGYVGARMSGSSDGNKFSRNVFAGNMHPVEIDTSIGDNEWSINGVGNYWDTAEVDLNGDGIGDIPHRETDLLGNLRRPFPLVALLSGSPGLGLLRFAQQHAAMPNVPAVLDPAPITNLSTAQRQQR